MKPLNGFHIFLLLAMTWISPSPRGGGEFSNPVGSAVRVNSCGPRALSTALRILGVEIDESELANLTRTDSNGRTTFQGLAEASRHLGLDAIGYETSLADIGKLPLPLIAHVHDSHFVVITAKTPTTLTVIDGPQQSDYSDEEFSRIWDGVVLAIMKPPSP